MAMEPMTLGSPVQSPIHLGVQPQFPGSGFQSPAGHQPSPFHSTAYNSFIGSGTTGTASTPIGCQSPALGTPNHHGTGPGTPGFLPGYLMGQFPQQNTTRVLSPTKLNRSVNTPGTPSGGRQLNGFLTPTTPAAQVRTPSEKPGGPPIRGLYANTPTQQKVKPVKPMNGLATPAGFGTPLNSTPQLSFGATPSGLRDQDLVEGSASEGTTWITVFGFPPSAASYIMSQFSQCGTILQHHIPPHGNWMNMRFQTKMQAQKALGRSGRIFGGTLMIGVAPCHDPPSEVNSSVVGQLDQTTADASVISLNSSLATHNRSIRPLTQSYKAAHNEHDVSMMNSTPNKSSGIVSKAMEYIFGW